MYLSPFFSLRPRLSVRKLPRFLFSQRSETTGFDAMNHRFAERYSHRLRPFEYRWHRTRRRNFTEVTIKAVAEGNEPLISETTGFDAVVHSITKRAWLRFVLVYRSHRVEVRKLQTCGRVVAEGFNSLLLMRYFWCGFFTDIHEGVAVGALPFFVHDGVVPLCGLCFVGRLCPTSWVFFSFPLCF